MTPQLGYRTERIRRSRKVRRTTNVSGRGPRRALTFVAPEAAQTARPAAHARRAGRGGPWRLCRRRRRGGRRARSGRRGPRAGTAELSACRDGVQRARRDRTSVTMRRPGSPASAADPSPSGSHRSPTPARPDPAAHRRSSSTFRDVSTTVRAPLKADEAAMPLTDALKPKLEEVLHRRARRTRAERWARRSDFPSGAPRERPFPKRRARFAWLCGCQERPTGRTRFLVLPR